MSSTSHGEPQTVTDTEIRLLLDERRENGYYHLVATVVKTYSENGTVRVRNTSMHGELYVSDLQVTSQGHDHDRLGRRRHLYAWTLAYRSPYEVRQDDAEHMLWTFKHISRKMRALEDELGTPSTYSAYLGRIALALGVEGFAIYTGLSQGPTYDDSEFRLLDITEGMAAADALIEQWQNEEAPREEDR